MGQRGPVEQYPYLVKAYLDGAGLEKLDALPGDSRSQKVRDLIEGASRRSDEASYQAWERRSWEKIMAS